MDSRGRRSGSSARGGGRARLRSLNARRRDGKMPPADRRAPGPSGPGSGGRVPPSRQSGLGDRRALHVVRSGQRGGRANRTEAARRPERERRRAVDLPSRATATPRARCLARSRRSRRARAVLVVAVVDRPARGRREHADGPQLLAEHDRAPARAVLSVSQSDFSSVPTRSSLARNRRPPAAGRRPVCVPSERRTPKPHRPSLHPPHHEQRPNPDIATRSAS